MPRRGNFRKCFDQMVEMVGREPSLELAIIFDRTHGDYILGRLGELSGMIQDYDSEHLRGVLKPTYLELREMLKPRQLDVFKEDKSVDNSKDLQTGE